MGTNKTNESNVSDLSDFEDLNISRVKNEKDYGTRESLQAVVADLLSRCKVLLSEIELFLDRAAQKNQKILEFRHFKTSILREIKFLEKLSDPSISAERVYNTTACSNVPFLEAVWATAKRSSNITGLRRHTGLYDISADNGLEWIKVSTVSDHRLLMEMAKQGWENESSDDDDEEYFRPSTGNDSDDDDGVSLEKMAEKLLKAARETRIRYKHPRIRFVLPKVNYGKVSQIDATIDGLRKSGVTVQCADEIPAPPPIEEAVQSMILDKLELSSTLNLDCTILLALISDLSHGKVAEQPWFNRAIRRQIEIEEKERLMPETLWPIMNDRNLVCTHEAAKRMTEITSLIGTDTEKFRMKILMGNDTSKSRIQLVEEFQTLSEYQVPTDWRIPVRVEILDKGSILDKLPKVAVSVATQLSVINQSVFLYGWATGWTTMTSNRTVSKQIETLIEESRTDEDEVGPDVWLCSTSRSLVAKEKDRKGV